MLGWFCCPDSRFLPSFRSTSSHIPLDPVSHRMSVLKALRTSAWIWKPIAQTMMLLADLSVSAMPSEFKCSGCWGTSRVEGEDKQGDNENWT